MSIPIKYYFGGILIDALNFAWGESGFESLFYISVVIILILEKNKKQRSIFSLYCIISLLAVYCPITLYLSHKIFFQGSPAIIAYYSRLFVLLPVISCISYAFILIIGKVAEEKRKYYFIALILLIIVLRSPTYNPKNFSIADNFEKVPSDVKQISILLKDVEGEKKVFMPIEPTVFIRTIDASITLPYARNSTDEYPSVVNQISGREEFNAAQVYKYCKDAACDYLVVNSNEEQIFTKVGYTLIGRTDTYSVLEVE